MLARHEWANSASGAVPVVLIRGGITKADFKTAAALQQLGDEGDDAWCDERAVDPLHCARIDAKPSGDLAHTGPSRSRQSLSDLFFEGRGYPGAARGVLWARKPVSGPARTVPQSSPEIPEPISSRFC
jgi:hypothetical protein